MASDQIEVNINNSGTTTFVIHYANPPTTRSGQVDFPFPSAPLDKLRCQSSDNVVSVRCLDPNSQQLIGQRVRVSYLQGEETVDLSGKLVKADKEILTIESEKGLLVIMRSHVLTLVYDTVQFGPKLELEWSGESETRKLAVSGEDAAFRFSASHTLQLEPVADSLDGAVVGTLITGAAITNLYDWDIKVGQITLTETNAPQSAKSMRSTRYEPESAAPQLMTMSAAPSQVAASAETGAVIVNAAVRIGRASAGPTVIGLSRLQLPDAKMHYLSTVRITETVNSVCWASLAVRLHRKVATSFVPSGPVTVLLDMDPAPGPFAFSAHPVGWGFFYNPWDTQNATRMYYDLGMSDTVKIDNEIIDEDNHDRTENRHTGTRKMSFFNATPYNAVVKLWLDSSDILVATKIVDTKNVTNPILVQEYVREQATDVKKATAHTLQVVVPANSTDKSSYITLKVEYRLYNV